MNRHERRSAKAKGRSYRVIQMDDEGRAKLIEQTKDPTYRRAIEQLARAMLEWRRAHPGATPVWFDPKGVLLMGADIGDETARGHIAANEAAHQCLLWADEQTGRRMTMMMVQFALVMIGLVERESS